MHVETTTTRTIEVRCLRHQLDRLESALLAAPYVADYWVQGLGHRVVVEVMIYPDGRANDTTIRNRLRIAAGLL